MQNSNSNNNRGLFRKDLLCNRISVLKENRWGSDNNDNNDTQEGGGEEATTMSPDRAVIGRMDTVPLCNDD